MADGLNEKQLRESISEIIKEGDLATLTSKKIRQILEAKYAVNLKDRKKQIDDIVMSLVDEQSDDSDGNPSPDRTNVTVKKSRNKESPAKRQKVESERVSVIATVPSEKKTAIKNDSTSDSDDEEDSDDDDDDDDNAPKPTVSKGRNKRQVTKKSSKEKTKSPKKEAGEKGEKVKKKTGFSMPMVLSPELATLMGETHMARSEVVKKMWQIIKERNLMDPSNKRYTICDEELEKIIGQKRFLTFSMMKYLKKHVKDPSLMVQ